MNFIKVKLVFIINDLYYIFNYKKNQKSCQIFIANYMPKPLHTYFQLFK